MFPTSYYLPDFFPTTYWERMPAFSTATIGPVQAVQEATDLFLAWTSPAQQGTAFQVYVNRKLVWHGTERAIAIPVPDGFASIQVGTVSAAEESTNFAALLLVLRGTGDRARLAWFGGTYLDPSGNDDVEGFRIYGSPAPGARVDYAAPLATLAAYPGESADRRTDGYGQGEFGLGGFGRSASRYSWTSPPLGGSGVWKFAVRPFDRASNESGLIDGAAYFTPACFTPLYFAPRYWAGGAAAVPVTIATRPRPPAANLEDKRLNYTYNPNSGVATLNWLPSPS